MAKTSQKKYLSKLKKEDPEFYATIVGSKELDLDSVDVAESDARDSDSWDECSEAGDDPNVSEDDLDDIYADEDEIPVKSKKTKNSKKQQIQSTSDDDDNEENDNIEDDVDSLEEEEEEEEEMPVDSSGKRVVVNSSLVKQWETQLQGNKPEDAFRNVSASLLAAIESLDCSNEADTGRFIVKSPTIFNQLVHTSLLNMAPALRKMLHLNNLAHLTSAKKFRKYAPIIKKYLQTLIKLHDCITEPTLREVIMRRGVLPLLAAFKVQPKQCRQFLKKLVTIWATGHNKLRVLAFVAIYRLVKLMDANLLDYSIKAMHNQYVQNCRFTSASSLGSICFMRLSLSELCNLNQPLAYKHAFIYIRQMAFHMRNAIIANKKEKMQLVYSWQYVHCLNLWCTLLTTAHPSKVLEPLLYPVVQLALGTMALQPSPRFFPLVLRVCGMMTDLSSATNTYITVLPYLLRVFSEIIESYKRNKKVVKDEDAVAKIPNWECVLKLSESEVGVASIMKSLLEECALQIARYLAAEAHSIAFPDMVVPAVIMLKKLEKTKEPFCQGLVRQLLRKISDHSDLILARRQDVPFTTVKERKKVEDWEIATRQLNNLPIVQFYEKLKSGITEDNVDSKKRKRGDQQASDKSNKKPMSALSKQWLQTAQESVAPLSLQDLN